MKVFSRISEQVIGKCVCALALSPVHQGPNYKNAVYSVNSHWTALDCKVNNLWWGRRGREVRGRCPCLLLIGGKCLSQCCTLSFYCTCQQVSAGY